MMFLIFLIDGCAARPATPGPPLAATAATGMSDSLVYQVGFT